MAFARPRSANRVARARNFIVGVFALAIIWVSQAWRSIAHREATVWPNNEAITYEDTVRTTKERAKTSPDSSSNELHAVGREHHSTANSTSSGSALTSLVSDAEPFSCAPKLTSSLAKVAAADSHNSKRIMLTMVSNHQLDFLHNWLASVREAGIKHILVGAMDDESALLLEKERVLCFKHAPPENIETLGLAWGQEGWRIMTWQQVFVVKELIDWGFDVTVTDIDFAWIRDPWPLFDRHPEADILFSHDGLTSRNQRPKEEDLELAGSAHYNLNTGIYIIRSTNATRDFMSAWISLFENSNQHDQSAMYSLLRNDTASGVQPTSTRQSNDPGLTPAFNKKLLIGVVPVYLFGNGHSYTVSCLHEYFETGKPIAIHATWTYSGKAGKISRLREAMLWHDSKEYYSKGNFVTVNLQVPEMPNNFNEIEENEPMIQFHLKALQMQLEQVGVGLAMASATNRVFIMPKLVCFCESGWYPGVKCRLSDSQSLKFPVNCPADYYFYMDQLNFSGGGEESSGDRNSVYTESVNSEGKKEEILSQFSVKEYSFLDNPRIDAAIKDSQATVSFVQTSVQQGEEEKAMATSNKVIDIAAGLTDKDLQAEIAPIHSIKVWNLDFSQLKTPWDAFGGFKCRNRALQFEERASTLLQDWCCRFIEEAEKYNTTEKVKLYMIPAGREFSEYPEIENC